jgi:N-hydroxyarylamine O-acetyltransferase
VTVSEVDRYLERIGYPGSREPTLATLTELHRAHLLTVPFENLDIALGRPLVLDRAANYAKIVDRRRGGWCYELNGMFGWLLEQLGFPVTLLGSRVTGHTTSVDLAHLLLLVDLDEPYIADVGFGDGSSLVPIPLADVADGTIPCGHQDIVFTLTPRTLEDFQEMCTYQQASPESGFVRVRKCTLALPDGRVTLRELVLSEERGGERTERELAGDDEWHAVLAERFGVVL